MKRSAKDIEIMRMLAADKEFQESLDKLYMEKLSPELREKYETGQKDICLLWTLVGDATVDGFKRGVVHAQEKRVQEQKKAEERLAQMRKKAEERLAQMRKKTESVINTAIIATHGVGMPMDEIAKMVGHSIDYVKSILSSGVEISEI